MKRILASLLMLIVTIPTFAADRKANAWVEKTLRSMTVDEKIGQLFVPMIPGGFRNLESDDFQKVRAHIVDYHVGGYHTYGGDAAGTALFINDMQAAARVPLLVTADLEGGAGYVIGGATRFPLAMGIGATGSEDFAYQAGKATAEEGRALGINVDFYPVVDVQNNPGNPIINIRSFGEDPDRVSRFGVAYLKGVQDGGMIATAKHFPGHGDVASDSHLEMPVLNVDRARLDAMELKPFRAAIGAGVGAVMSAHINVPALEKEKGLPSTLSHAVLTDLLRKELGFTGLIFTDAMDMHGVTNAFTNEEAAVRAVEAGADIILFPPDVPAMFNAVKAAVQSGRVPLSRIEESDRRILAAKAGLGLTRYQRTSLDRLSSVVGSKAHHDLSQRISEAAVTLVRDNRNAVPLRPSPDKRVLVINLLDTRMGWREGPVGLVCSAEMLKRFPNAITIQIDDLTTANELDLAHKLADLVDAVVVNGFIRVAAYKGTTDLTPGQMRFLRDLSKLEKPFIFTLFGSPYLLHHLPELPSYMLTYDTNPGAELAAVKALTGEIPISGKLPISLPGLYKIGDGIVRPAAQ